MRLHWLLGRQVQPVITVCAEGALPGEPELVTARWKAPEAKASGAFLLDRRRRSLAGRAFPWYGKDASSILAGGFDKTGPRSSARTERQFAELEAGGSSPPADIRDNLLLWCNLVTRLVAIEESAGSIPASNL